MPKGIYKRTKPAWNKGLTKDDPRVKSYIDHQKQTNMGRYGCITVFGSKQFKDGISEERHSGVLAQKAMETKLKRYGDCNYNNKDKAKQTKEIRYGDPYYNNMEKMYDTKRKNKSFNTSKPEEILYSKLINLYKRKLVTLQ